MPPLLPHRDMGKLCMAHLHIEGQILMVLGSCSIRIKCKSSSLQSSPGNHTPQICHTIVIHGGYAPHPSHQGVYECLVQLKSQSAL